MSLFFRHNLWVWCSFLRDAKTRTPSDGYIYSNTSVSEQGQSGREVCHSKITMILRPRTCIIAFLMCTKKKGLIARNRFCSNKDLTQSKKVTFQHKALPMKTSLVTLQWALKTHHRSINHRTIELLSKRSLPVCTTKEVSQAFHATCFLIFEDQSYSEYQSYLQRRNVRL